MGKAQDYTPLPWDNEDKTYHSQLIQLDIPLNHHRMYWFHSLKTISHSQPWSKCPLIYFPRVLLVLDNHNTHLPKSKSWNIKKTKITPETSLDFYIHNKPKTDTVDSLLFKEKYFIHVTYQKNGKVHSISSSWRYQTKIMPYKPYLLNWIIRSI